MLNHKKLWSYNHTRVRREMLTHITRNTLFLLFGRVIRRKMVMMLPLSPLDLIEFRI